MDVLSILDNLSLTTKKTEKLAILELHKHSQLLQTVLKYALCPHIQFNIKKIPVYTPTDSETLTLDAAIEAFKVNLVDRGITGSIARTEFLKKTLESVNPSNAEVLERIIKKDLRAGVAEGLVNKVFPGLIPPWPCLLAESYDSKTIKRITFPALCQLKSDGTRINVIVKGGTVSYYGRSGKSFDFLGRHDSAFLELAKQIGIDDVMFDGECLVSAGNGYVLKRETGNGIISRALKGTITQEESDSVVFDLWDFVPYYKFTEAKDTTPYVDRYNKLKVAMDQMVSSKVRLIETHIVESLADAFEIYEIYLAQGFEGAVLKNYNTIWEDKRSKDQIKLKAEKECEVRVTAINPGNGKYAGLIGSLACTTADGVIVDVSGFPDEFRRLPANEVIGKIITVRYNAVTSDSKTGIMSLFLPRFVELRHDKTIPDSIL